MLTGNIANFLLKMHNYRYETGKLTQIIKGLHILIAYFRIALYDKKIKKGLSL